MSLASSGARAVGVRINGLISAVAVTRRVAVVSFTSIRPSVRVQPIEFGFIDPAPRGRESRPRTGRWKEAIRRDFLRPDSISTPP